ncbi:MAG: bifunctional phosphoribosyl-AMP cyclohydrolase/phosphoribosyl-ATP diphosphatase HisIE [Chloroflexi bacterium]|nr:bifunctional phosphoribosyl-AMP cyclohydrolase/phosphoribosyl-ATP diphosphatase HisIE [Chloroflexota bacterium]
MVRFNDRGLIPAIVQDDSTGDVLTLAYMNEEALRRTLAGPDVWFYSRSRKSLWHKGETSGNFLKVKSVIEDCDADAVLVRADPTGPACHKGSRSCFNEPVQQSGDATMDAGPGIIDELYDVIKERKENPAEGSYTTSLFESGRERIAQKVIEEAGEWAIAGLGDDPEPGDRLRHVPQPLEVDATGRRTRMGGSDQDGREGLGRKPRCPSS